jgi:hypothetical protein
MDALIVNKVKASIESVEAILKENKDCEFVEVKLKAIYYLSSSKFDLLLNLYGFEVAEAFYTGKSKYIYLLKLRNKKHKLVEQKAQHFIDKGVFNDIVVADVFTDLQEIILNKKNKSSIYIVSCFDENKELLFDAVKEILFDQGIKINYRSSNYDKDKPIN